MADPTARSDVDLKQLTALVTVAETGSVTRAAAVLHLVQPAVTRQIKALEDELGVALFERTRYGMRVTEQGKVLVDRARRALGELERARAEVRPDPGVVTGIVTVGLLASTAVLLAEPLASLILREHPGIDLRVLVGYSGHLQQWQDDGDVDVTLLYNLTRTPTLNVVPLLKERLWAVAGPHAGLRSDVPVRLEDMVRHPMIMPSTGHGLRTLVDEATASAGIRADIVMETNSLDLQKQFVVAGHGWTLLPPSGVRDDVMHGRLTAAPVCDPEIERTIVLALPRTGRTPEAVGVVANALAQVVVNAVRQDRWPSATLLRPDPTV